MVEYAVVGGLAVDSVVNAQGISMPSQFGGNAAYGAAGARIWAPGKVGMVARKGNDFPDEWIQSIRDAGIDISGVTRIPKRHTLGGGMVYDDRGDRREWHGDDQTKGSKESKASDEAQRDFGADSSDIPLEFATVKGVLLAPRYYEKQLSCVNYYREKNPAAKIALDVGIWYMHPDRIDDLRRLFAGVDAVLPSEVEVKELFGDIDMEDAARKLGDLGAKLVVVKVGKEGCIVYERETDEITRLPICKVNAKDPTGAGDSFCGGFLVGLCKTGDPIMAALHGTVSSSFVVSGFGVAYTYDITCDMAQQRLNNLIQTVTQKNPKVAQRLKGLGYL